MARKNRNTIPAEAQRLVTGVGRSNPATVLGVSDGNSIISTSGDDVFPTGWINNKNRIGLNELGVSGEAATHARYQARTAPWLTLPAGQAIINILANAVARLPAKLVHDETGEEKPLPDLLEFPLGRAFNPTFQRRAYWKMIVRNLFLFGNSHILTCFEEKKPIMLRPMDSNRLQTYGGFTRPYWKVQRRGVLWWGSYLNSSADEDLPDCAIYPDGRYLPEDGSLMGRGFEEESRNYGMLVMYINRSPESNNGVPPGMLNFNGTLSAVYAQRHAVDFHEEGTFRQVLLTPDARLTGEAIDTVAGSQEDMKKNVEARHRAIISGVPWQVQELGFDAEKAQLIPTRESDMAMQAVAHGLPPSQFAARGASHAQVYADMVKINTDGTLPIVMDVEDQHSLLFDENYIGKGWRLRFSRAAMMQSDPHTIAKINEIMLRSGESTMDEARERSGEQTYEEYWSETHFMDGNRRAARKLASAAAGSGAAAGKKTEGGQPKGDKDVRPAYEETPAKGKGS